LVCIVQHAFGTVIWIVCGLGIVIALVALVMSGRTWQDYGRGGLTLDSETRSRGGGLSERDDEIRQLLEARNARRRRRGEAPIDVDAELAHLTAASHIDAELREEIRQLVIARNHRRARAGKAPLDVDAEVEREILNLQGL
jgi:hypothetical protein